MSNVTNEEYVELIESMLAELKPDQPVKALTKMVTDPRTKRVSEKLAIMLDIFNGPKTEVLFNKTDVLGLGELQLRTFITSKLVSIGVHPTPDKKDAPRVTDAPEKPVVPTDAEAAKVREMLAKRRPAVPVSESLYVSDLDPEEDFADA